MARFCEAFLQAGLVAYENEGAKYIIRFLSLAGNAGQRPAGGNVNKRENRAAERRTRRGACLEKGSDGEAGVRSNKASNLIDPRSQLKWLTYRI